MHHEGVKNPVQMRNNLYRSKQKMRGVGCAKRHWSNPGTTHSSTVGGVRSQESMLFLAFRIK